MQGGPGTGTGNRDRQNHFSGTEIGTGTAGTVFPDCPEQIPNRAKKWPKNGLWPHREKGGKMAEKWEKGVWDPPTPDPEKVQKKSEKKIVDFQTFLDFSDFFWLFQGPGSGGPKLLSGHFFETFRFFGVLGSVDGGGDCNAGSVPKPEPQLSPSL